MKNGKYILTTGVFALVSGIALSGLLPMQRAKAEESKENVLIIYAINKNGITKLNPVMNEETKVESGGGEGEETTVLPPSLTRLPTLLPRRTQPHRQPEQHHHPIAQKISKSPYQSGL